jgi:hypothetical protein
MRFPRGCPHRPARPNPDFQSIQEWRRQIDKMGRSDRECTVCVFRNCWPGRWASMYRDTLSWSFRFNIYFQAFPPANAIFVGIGVLLLVGILHLSLAQNYFDNGIPRLLTMRALVKKR